MEVKIKQFTVFFEQNEQPQKIVLYGFHTVKEASNFFEKNYEFDEYAISSAGFVKFAVDGNQDFVQDFLAKIMEG